MLITSQTLIVNFDNIKEKRNLFPRVEGMGSTFPRCGLTQPEFRSDGWLYVMWAGARGHDNNKLYDLLLVSDGGLDEMMEEDAIHWFRIVEANAIKKITLSAEADPSKTAGTKICETFNFVRVCLKRRPSMVCAISIALTYSILQITGTDFNLGHLISLWLLRIIQTI